MRSTLLPFALVFFVAACATAPLPTPAAPPAEPRPSAVARTQSKPAPSIAMALAEPASEGCSVTTSPAPTTIHVGDVVYASFCAPQIETWAMKVDGKIVDMRFDRDAVADPVSGNFQFRTINPVTLSAGAHSIAFVQVGTSGEVAGTESVAVPVTVVSTIPDSCTPPLGPDAISIFITRYQVATSVLTDISFRLTSRSPITSVSVMVDGVAVKTVAAPGVDYREFSGLWIDTPSKGRHDLSVRATNTVGCTTTSPSSVTLQVD